MSSVSIITETIETYLALVPEFVEPMNCLPESWRVATPSCVTIMKELASELEERRRSALFW